MSVDYEIKKQNKVFGNPQLSLFVVWLQNKSNQIQIIIFKPVCTLFFKIIILTKKQIGKIGKFILCLSNVIQTNVLGYIGLYSKQLQIHFIFWDDWYVNKISNLIFSIPCRIFFTALKRTAQKSCTNQTSLRFCSWQVIKTIAKTWVIFGNIPNDYFHIFS